MAIDWSVFQKRSDDRFIRLVAGEPKTLKLTTVEQTTTTVPDTSKPVDEQGIKPTKDIPCLVFTVVEEDGKPVDKVFSVTSKNLALSLKDVATKLANKEVADIVLKITQYGSGYETYYRWCQLIDNKETETKTTKQPNK